MADLRRTACSRDCPDACSILVTVEDGRAIRLQGDRDDPITRGFLCARTNRFLGRQYADDRFTSPMRRRNGRLEPIGWDDALDLAAERLADCRSRLGPASILHYRSGGSLGILKAVADHFFERFGPVTIKRGDICSGSGEAAQIEDFGISDSHDLDDLANSALIVNWGKNPHTSGVHLVPHLKRAAERGTPLVTIDPVRTRSAAASDLAIQPRAGGDLALAMGVARWLFDHGAVDADLPTYADHVDAFEALAHERSVDAWATDAGVAPSDVEALAERLATTRPAAILVGWGLARRRHGGAAVRAIDALGLLTGNIGVPGGGVSYYFGRRTAFDLDFNRGIDAAPRTLAESRLGPEILAAEDPPIEAIWVTAGNPVSMLPEANAVREAFVKTPFVVVVDTHPTDTTDLADLVLPTCTLLEDDDLVGAYGNHYLRASRPAVDAPPGVRHEVEIFRALAARFDLGGLLDQDVRGWKDTVTRRLRAAGVTPDTLADGPIRNPFAPNVLFADRRFPTPNGRARLLTALPADATPPDDAYPLTLLAASTPRAQASQWSTRPPSPPPARVHPDATALADGADAWVESALDRIAVRVLHDDSVRPGIVAMEKGGMFRTGSCPNALIRATETDLGGGAAYYDQPVRLVRCERGA